jgi:hypothetical protein
MIYTVDGKEALRGHRRPMKNRGEQAKGALA